ncbi:MAG: SAM-dependent methyltransferase, partial [Spirochaetales bacterium]|nr:SAM-dependent methyltransferase [Spirochaetales bacterium]
VTLQALHHIEDRERALGILTDHLEKGGFLCLADLVEEDGSFHKNESVPHNGFKVEELEEILGRLGLRKISTTYPYSNSRTRKGKVREYPVFLMIFQK